MKADLFDLDNSSVSVEVRPKAIDKPSIKHPRAAQKLTLFTSISAQKPSQLPCLSIRFNSCRESRLTYRVKQHTALIMWDSNSRSIPPSAIATVTQLDYYSNAS